MLLRIGYKAGQALDAVCYYALSTFFHLEVTMPRPDVSEERKSQILNAATTVFARLGFHETRMDDIAQEAGLSKAALYLYYKSKDAIIAALLKFFFAQELKKLHEWLSSEREGSVSQQILDITHEMIADLGWMSKMLPVTFEFYAVAARREDVRVFLKEHFREYRTLFAALIQSGIDQGEFRSVDAGATAITLTALYEGLTLLWIFDPQTVRWEEVGESSVQLMLDGLRATSPVQHSPT
jgi:AcrR family transcriptional regulator